MIRTSRFVELSSSAVFLVVSLALFPGCPQTGIVCREGTVRCGEGCADLATDERNCGACGTSCSANQVCQGGGCQCRTGAVTCDGFCVVTSSDTRHCGGCNQPCQSGQVCEQGTCKVACTLGTSLRCGTSCVNPATDDANCGGCGVACATGSRCIAGRCSADVLAACFGSGELVPFDTVSDVRGPAVPLGTGPAALGAYGKTVLALDGVDRKVLQAQADAGAYVQLTRAVDTGAVPNQMLVDGTYVYVVNAESGTLQVLKDGAGGAGDGVPLGTVAELPLGAQTWPEGAVKVLDELWVPLYGGYGASDADAGQRVLRIGVSNPELPTVLSEVDLKGLDLKAFDGGAPVARPWAVAWRSPYVYVALSNLNPSTYVPEGPGLLARIEPEGRVLAGAVDLGATRCLNPQWVAVAGNDVLVSCGGKVTYNMTTYAVENVEAAGLVKVDGTDTVTAEWAPTCPPDAGLDDGGTTCPPFMPGRFAVRDGKVYLADQNAGRLAVLELTAGGFVELRGPSAAAGPVQACTPDAVTGIANVSDVLSAP